LQVAHEHSNSELECDVKLAMDSRRRFERTTHNTDLPVVWEACVWNVSVVFQAGAG